MAGHSKWSKVKRIKAVTDVKKAKISPNSFVRSPWLRAKAAAIPDGNPRLRTALAIARVKNLTKDNIDRAIKKGMGTLKA
jgi:transcriptional/translational regulatory protein YebC/TACO1